MDVLIKSSLDVFKNSFNSFKVIVTKIMHESG